MKMSLVIIVGGEFMATGVWDSRNRCRGTQRQHLSGQSFLNL